MSFYARFASFLLAYGIAPGWPRPLPLEKGHHYALHLVEGEKSAVESSETDLERVFPGKRVPPLALVGELDLVRKKPTKTLGTYERHGPIAVAEVFRIVELEEIGDITSSIAWKYGDFFEGLLASSV